MTLKDELAVLGIKIIRKDHSRLMRVIGWILKRFKIDFMGSAWTTIGPKRIYASTRTPLSIENHENLEQWEHIIRHELVHVKQAKKYPIFWQFSYLFLFLPIGLAWFRWYWEREAYLTVNIQKYGADPDAVADTLSRMYLWPWPNSWMKRWFWDNKFRSNLF